MQSTCKTASNFLRKLSLVHFLFAMICRFLLSTLIFFVISLPLQGQRFSNSLIEKNRDRYSNYEQCLHDRKQRIEKLGTQPIEAIAVKQGASVKLECFHCLHPTQQEIVEDVWKPNDNFIGRKVRSAIYNVKQKLRKQLEINVQKPNISWEFMPLQKNAKWTPVIDLQEPTTIFRKFARTIKSFTSTSTRKIGRLFELEIPNAGAAQAGWYRCIQRANDSIRISSLYFVDIFSSADNATMKQHQKGRGDNEKVLQVMPSGLIVFEQPTKWTACNKCGANETGHQLRQVACRVKIDPNKNLQDRRLEFLRLFGDVPCRSSLIPLDVRKAITNYTDGYEFKDCQERCPPLSNETRIIQRMSITGEREIVDELKPGEYSVHERLPPLQPKVDRRVINKIEDDPLVLDCGEVGAIFWHRDFQELNASTLLANDEPDRIYMTNEGQLVFKRLELEDRGLYSCFVPPYQLRRTFRLYVAESDRTAELISLIQMSIRFMAVFLLVILVITVVAGTDSRVERHRPVNP